MFDSLEESRRTNVILIRCVFLISIAHLLITLVVSFKELATIFVYYFTYNVALFAFFLVLCKTLHSNVRTLSDLKLANDSTFSIFSLIIILFSMAGVPPFAGFFTKLLIVKLVFNSGWGFFFLFFLAMILLTLFFYFQNVRFLLVPFNDSSNLNPIFASEILCSSNTSTLLIILINIFLILGFVLINFLFATACWFLI